MRMNLPQCNIKNCRCYSDGNCLYRNEWEKCEYTILRKEVHNVTHGLERILEKIEQVL